MNWKLKLFYVIDLFIMILSLTFLLLLNNSKEYGLSALTNSGYFALCLLIFLLSIIICFIVIIVNICLKIKVSKNKKKHNSK